MTLSCLKTVLRLFHSAYEKFSELLIWPLKPHISALIILLSLFHFHDLKSFFFFNGINSFWFIWVNMFSLKPTFVFVVMLAPRVKTVTSTG